jgi:hypothetical protein
MSKKERASTQGDFGFQKGMSRGSKEPCLGSEDFEASKTKLCFSES